MPVTTRLRFARCTELDLRRLASGNESAGAILAQLQNYFLLVFDQLDGRVDVPHGFQANRIII